MINYTAKYPNLCLHYCYLLSIFAGESLGCNSLVLVSSGHSLDFIGIRRLGVRFQEYEDRS
jgi:hypothetical protein